MELSEIFPGRPEVGTRTDPEECSYALLDTLKIPFLRIDHEEAPSMDSLQPVEAALGCSICKNLFLTNRQQTEFYLLLMPGNKPFKTKYLSKQLQCTRLSFAEEPQLQSLLGVSHGSASVLALLRDPQCRIHLIIDEELRACPYFACHPCKNTSTLRFDTEDVFSVLIPALGHNPTFVCLPWETD